MLVAYLSVVRGMERVLRLLAGEEQEALHKIYFT